MLGFDTAINVINDAAVEVGLTAFTDTWTGTSDPSFLLFQSILKTLVRGLMRRRQWTHLQQSHIFSTVLNQGYYTLPADFGRMIDQTGWNRTNGIPVGGPVSPQAWEFLKGQAVGIVINVMFRPLQGQLWLYPDATTPAGYQIAYEYISRFGFIPKTTWTTYYAAGPGQTFIPWRPATTYANNAYVLNQGNIYQQKSGASGVSSNSGPHGASSGQVDNTCTWNFVIVAGADLPADNGDVVYLDPDMVHHGLRMEYLKRKGFDYSAAESDFERCLEDVTGEDKPGRVLSLDRGGNGIRYIGPNNLPVTGWAGGH